MKTKIHFALCTPRFALALALLSTLSPQLSTFGQGTAFTYQGRLTSGTNAASGSFDMRFYLRDALTGGNPIGTTNTIAPVLVSNGFFTVVVDFGSGIFTGPARWLEIALRTNGSSAAYTTLNPRQPLTATPYAIMAGNAVNLGGQSSSAFAPAAGSSSYVARAGDTMTGTLNLPANGLALGGSQLLASGGNIGIGVANPAAHVQINQAAAGVGLFLGNRTPFGQALFQTDVTAPATHAWFAENGNRVFSVTGGGRLDVAGHAYFTGGADISDGTIYASYVSANNGSSVFAPLNGENTGPGPGVYGLNDSTGAGVLGKSTSGSGVSGASTSGRGVYGTTATAGPTVAGVYGENSAAGGTAVVGTALNVNSAGVAGVADTSGSTGVYGRGTTVGVSGTSTSGRGVYGTTATAGATVAGVYGENSAAGGTAVVGAALNVNSAGVAGVADTSGSTGVYGRGTTYGVFGTSTSGVGVYGVTHGVNQAGVLGENYGSGTADPYAAGVLAITHGRSGGLSGGVAVHGLAVGGDTTAGAFDGSVGISTDLFVNGSKNFKIDHPLDPANKYLLHSCVESPEVKNIYDGTITTDESGNATVTLPGYFEALNRDFRYQLTVIGRFAQAIVSGKVQNNQFTIKTDQPGVEVSWQVTGIRQDAYIKAHPMVVEQEKPGPERGTYQHPELFGQPEEKGLSWAQNPELWKRLKAERDKPASIPKP